MAVALNHLVHFLQRRGIKRGWAIVLVMLGACLLLAGVLLLVIPAAVAQGRALVEQAPKLLGDIRSSGLFSFLDRNFDIEAILPGALTRGGGIAQAGSSPVLGAIGGVLSAVAATATMAALVVFMLVFGPGLLSDLTHLSTSKREPSGSALRHGRMRPSEATSAACYSSAPSTPR